MFLKVRKFQKNKRLVGGDELALTLMTSFGEGPESCVTGVAWITWIITFR